MIVDGYVRVSHVSGRSGENFISPVVQREQIERWANAQGAVLGRVFEEFDESGGRRDRPLLEQAIRRVEASESDGLVVAYLSRFGRSLVDGLAAIERITKAGGTFVSVQDGLDFSTDTGRLILRFLLSVAEWELDRTRTGWLVAKERAVLRGVYPCRAPFGYRRSRRGRLEINPETGPIAVELFRRRATGARYADLQRFLRDRQVPSPDGLSVWSPMTIAALLRRRAYLGEVRSGAVVNEDAHPPLVTPEDWDAAQLGCIRRPRRTDLPTGLLLGVLRCASCGRRLRGALDSWGSSYATRVYGCARYDHPGDCTKPAAVRDTVIEPYIEALFLQELPRRRRPTAALRRIRNLEEELERRNRELAAYRDNAHLPTTLGAERFADGLAVRLRRVEAVQVDLSAARAGAGSTYSPQELREKWRSLSLPERRRAIGELFESVYVSRGKGNVASRTVVCVRGADPTARHCGPIDFATTPRGPKLRPVADWPHERVREELVEFLRDQERWPSFPEFQVAGQAQLYAQADRRGGPARWAQIIGIPYVPPGNWSEERIRAELKGFLAGETEWPTVRHFCRHGQRDLRRAVQATGGPHRWAAEAGVRLPPSRTHIERWSYARMKEEVAELTAGRSDWPRHHEFVAAGKKRLYESINRKKVRDRLASELGLYLPPDRKQIRGRWTEPAIKATLDELLKGRSSWPTQQEFRAAGLDGLRVQLARDRTRDAWARRYKLAPPVPGRRRAVTAAR